VLCGPVRALVFGGTNVVWTPLAPRTPRRRQPASGAQLGPVNSPGC